MHLLKYNKLEPRDLTHSVKVMPDDGKPVTFRWHWPRNTFAPRMSAYEIAEFVMPHMPSIVPLLARHPRVQTEFQAMLMQFATQPREVLDRLMTWVKPVIRTEEDDLIELSISGVQRPQPVGPTYSYFEQKTFGSNVNQKLDWLGSR